MALPSAIADALADVNLGKLPGTPVDDSRTCQAAKFHSPTPLLLHPVKIDGHEVLLCGTCRDQFMVLGVLMDHHGELPWPVRRSFGNRLRALLNPKETDA